MKLKTLSVYLPLFTLIGAFSPIRSACAQQTVILQPIPAPQIYTPPPGTSLIRIVPGSVPNNYIPPGTSLIRIVPGSVPSSIYQPSTVNAVPAPRLPHLAPSRFIPSYPLPASRPGTQVRPFSGYTSNELLRKQMCESNSMDYAGTGTRHRFIFNPRINDFECIRIR